MAELAALSAQEQPPITLRTATGLLAATGMLQKWATGYVVHSPNWLG